MGGDPLDAPQPAPKTLRDVMNGIDIPAIPSGEGEIAGTVKTLDGRGVEGVEIAAASEFPERHYYRHLPPVERIEKEIRYVRWLDESVHRVTTGPNGNFRITGLAEDLRYSLTASAAGWAFRNEEPNQRKLKPSGTWNFIALPLTSMNVTVKRSDGSLVDEALILYRSKALTSQEHAYSRDGEAQLHLTPGEWTIYAASRDYDYSRDRLRYKSANLEVVVEEGKPVQSIQLVLEPTPFIGGKIAVPPGYSRLGVEVKLQPDPSGAVPNGSTDEIDGLIRAAVWAEGDGLV